MVARVPELLIPNFKPFSGTSCTAEMAKLADAAGVESQRSDLP
jgi:hypothetical protein